MIRPAARCTILLLCLTAGFAACSPRPSDDRPAAHGEMLVADPVVQLTAQAQAEAQLEHLHPLAVEPPPVIPADWLVRLDDAAPWADQPWRAIVADIAAEAPTPEPAATAPTEPRKTDLALRRYIAGRDLVLQGLVQRAMAEFEQAILLDPNRMEPLRELASIYGRVGQTSHALQLYERVLAIDPVEPEALITLAMQAESTGEPRRVVQLIARRLLIDQPFDHDAAGDVLALHLVYRALSELGCDRAVVQLHDAMTDAWQAMDGPTRYVQRMTFIQQESAQRLLQVGDALCRLGQIEDAFEAYAVVARQGVTDDQIMLPRIMYVQLRLGRSHGAAMNLFNAVQHAPEGVRAEHVLMARWLADAGIETRLLRQAVRSLATTNRQSPTLMRLQAALNTGEARITRLEEAHAAYPDDPSVVIDLYRALVAVDPSRAMARCLEHIAQQPHLHERYTQQLLVSVQRIDAARRALGAFPASPTRALLEIRLVTEQGALGRAWQLVQQARERWPNQPYLLAQQVQLAGMMQDKRLLDPLLDEVAAFDHEASWLALARAHRALGDADDALYVAGRALQAAPQNPEVLTTLAGLLLQRAANATTPQAQQDAANLARQYAMDALVIDQAYDSAYAVLFTLHQNSGILANQSVLEELAQQLRAANPDSALFARRAARELVPLRQYNRAQLLLLTAYLNRPVDRESLTLLIDIWKLRNEDSFALHWLRQQLTAHPDQPALLEQWTNLAMQVHGGEWVCAELEARWRAEPDNTTLAHLLEAVARQSGRNELATELGEQRLLERPLTPRTALELAALYAQADRWRDALANLEVACSDPGDAPLLESSLRILMAAPADNVPAARLTRRLARQAVEQNPRSSLVIYTAGLRAMLTTGSAESQIDEWIDRMVSDARDARGDTAQASVIWRDVAQLLVDAAHPAVAARVLRARILAPDPLDQTALSLLAGMYVACDGASAATADNTLDLLHTLHERGHIPALPGETQPPTLASALYNASNIFTVIGNNDAALHLLEESVDLDKSHAMALNNLGYARLNHGVLNDTVVASIERAIELDPTSLSIIDTLAWLRYLQGHFTSDDTDTPGAIELLAPAVEAADPDDLTAELFDHLGDIHWRLGSEDLAMEAWTRGRDMLRDPQRRAWLEGNYRQIQRRAWGVLVVDPKVLYDRYYVPILERLTDKVDAVQAGGEPPITPLIGTAVADDADASQAMQP
jgi:tetratricopeptide (TPR) repeat protein